MSKHTYTHKTHKTSKNVVFSILTSFGDVVIVGDALVDSTAEHRSKNVAATADGEFFEESFNSASGFIFRDGGGSVGRADCTLEEGPDVFNPG